MKVILPLAGKGTRLLPLTKHVPKPMVRVAGRPVIDYVMDKLDGLDVEELIIITGHLKEQVEDYVRRTYDVPARFVEQKVQDGTAGAVNLARPFVDGPVMIIFVDTLFDADLTIVRDTSADGVIWAKEVEDYQRYGVIVTDDEGYMTKIVEKPSEPVSKLANIGLYYIRDWKALFQGIDHTLARPANKGEWYLTDAFQHMIDHGRRILTAEVGGWYDCGKLDTLLDTNRHLLQTSRRQTPNCPSDVRLIPPVRIGRNAALSNVKLGPNVTIDDGAVIDGSTLRDTIVGERARVINSTITESLIGHDTVVEGVSRDRIIAAGPDLVDAP